MGFKQVRLYQFRNIVDQTIDLDARDVFLIGENGQGKTNILEAIYLLCYGSSFRTKKDSVFIRTGCKEGGLIGHIETTDGGQLDIRLVIQRGTKRIEVNGAAVSDRKELVRNVPCIVFCHDDIRFVTGPPDNRRWFFNQTLSLFDEMFIDVLRRYTRILRNRNSAIREEQIELLDVYDQQLADTGHEVQERRAHTVGLFSETFEQLFHTISGFETQLRILYRPSWDEDSSPETIRATLREKRDQDLRMGTTTSGPHRDRFRFEMNGAEFTETASTGQLRLLSLILRVAQSTFYSAQSGRRPILLLDDVMLELDPRRRMNFFAALPGYDQALFTFLPDEQFSSLRRDDTLEYTVQAGTVHGKGG